MKQLSLPSTRAIISTAASAAATTMFLRSVLRKYLPYELHHYLRSKVVKLITSFFSTQVTLVIEENRGFTYNQLFKASQLYLAPHIDPNSKRFRVTMPKNHTKISVTMDTNEQITDHFNGVKFTWKYVPPSYFELRFHKRHREMALEEYLPHVMEKAEELKQERKKLKLFTLKREGEWCWGGGKGMWTSVNLDHPATFETLAMDSEVKRGIMEDLDKFLERRDMYRRVGKAWKRGYLLFGPPGTGKSTLVAAMANYLNFDVYDLQLTGLARNSDLRKLLISTGNRSILVVEDIDCSLELHDRLTKPPIQSRPKRPKPKVTLSGFMNFIDGLWSSCGDERIIVFTTNRKEKLDPALLRPGRMDVHIHMSYCTPCGFRTLASNYLGITHHPLFDRVDHLLKMTNVTPAQVCEELLKNEDPEIALTSLIQLLLENKFKNQQEMNP